MSSYDRKDKFYHKAKEEGYAARSSYKLIEMDKKFGIFKAGSRIVDLGCAPGGWLQVGAQRLHGKGQIVGIDLLPLHIEPPQGTTFIQGDFLLSENQTQIRELLQGNADWIVSDMAPNMTGVKFKDLASSLELCDMAFDFAQQVLKNGGGLVVKIFPGPESADLQKRMKKCFNSVTVFNAEATRKTSNEVYLVAKGFKKTT
jgi:23S rRNA (uridine2552-2'-O)-methyltransferase